MVIPVVAALSTLIWNISWRATLAAVERNPYAALGAIGGNLMVSFFTGLILWAATLIAMAMVIKLVKPILRERA